MPKPWHQLCFLVVLQIQVLPTLVPKTSFDATCCSTLILVSSSQRVGLFYRLTSIWIVIVRLPLSSSLFQQGASEAEVGERPRGKVLRDAFEVPPEAEAGCPPGLGCVWVWPKQSETCFSRWKHSGISTAPWHSHKYTEMVPKFLNKDSKKRIKSCWNQYLGIEVRSMFRDNKDDEKSAKWKEYVLSESCHFYGSIEWWVTLIWYHIYD